MKQILIVLIAVIFCQNIAAAEKVPPSSYLNRAYVGLSYDKALRKNRPFLLIFASSKDVSTILKTVPLGKFIYNNFYHDFNFSILNTEKEANAKLAKLFKVEKLPALFIVDTKRMTYVTIKQEHYNNEDLETILNEFLVTRKYK